MLEREARSAQIASSQNISLGNTSFTIHATRAAYLTSLTALFAQKILAGAAKKASGTTLELFMLDAPAHLELFSENKDAGTDRLSIHRDKKHGIITLETRWFRVFFQKKGKQCTGIAFVKHSATARKVFTAYLPVVVYEILFSFGLTILHAATVQVSGKTVLLVGESGAGKSTAALMLAKHGATIVAEDHTLIRATRTGFTARGYEDISRVTRASEKHIFDKPLPFRAKKIGNFLKKEFPLQNYFTCLFFRDVPIDCIFFIRKSRVFRITEMSPRDSALRLMESNGQFFKMNESEQYIDYIDYFCRLSRGVRSFELERGDSIAELTRLEDFIQTLA